MLCQHKYKISVRRVQKQEAIKIKFMENLRLTVTVFTLLLPLER